MLIWGFTGKSNFYEGVHEKPIYKRELPKKGTWTVLRGGVGGLGEEDGGGVLKGVNTPMHTISG